MQKKLQNLKKEILENLEKVRDSQVLRDLEVKYLGRKGELTKVLRNLKNLDTKQKKEMGKLANEIKIELIEKFEEAKNVIMGKASSDKQIDVTLPGTKAERGHLHPVTIIQEELNDLFTSLGFRIVEGPELESDYYNFEVLNIPKNHPARDMQDTFFVDPSSAKASEGKVKREKGKLDLVMRTQVTSIQVRAMKEFGAPLRCIMPGRVFRSEAIDASHDHTFYQMDGFMVGEDISISNMVAVMKQLLSGILKKEVVVRTRPGYFPFVEPGIEIDIECQLCSGKGCPACKQSGWVEILPGGMIHPNVLRAGGLDPNKYNGFAFDVGVTRLAMMKYGIDDIRLFHSGDLRFLQQF